MPVCSWFCRSFSTHTCVGNRVCVLSVLVHAARGVEKACRQIDFFFIEYEPPKKSLLPKVWGAGGGGWGTCEVPVISWAQLCHWGQRSHSRKVVWLEVEQQCSWLNQKPTRQTPSFMSVSQWVVMSMPAAAAPGAAKTKTWWTNTWMWRTWRTWKYIPAMRPTRSMSSHPENASQMLSSRAHSDSLLLLLI